MPRLRCARCSGWTQTLDGMCPHCRGPIDLVQIGNIHLQVVDVALPHGAVRIYTCRPEDNSALAMVTGKPLLAALSIRKD